MTNSEVVIVSGVRTAVGTFGGSLKDMPPTELGARCVREARPGHHDGHRGAVTGAA